MIAGEFIRLDHAQVAAIEIATGVVLIVLALLAWWMGHGLGTELYNNWLDRKENR